LRHDPLLALLAGRRDLTTPLAGKSTLNRMELAPAGSPLTERYHRITYSSEALDALLVQIFLEAHPKPPREVVLDLDVTDTPLHQPTSRSAGGGEKPSRHRPEAQPNGEPSTLDRFPQAGREQWLADASKLP